MSAKLRAALKAARLYADDLAKYPDSPQYTEAIEARNRLEAIATALYTGDVDTLNRLAACHCCCREHTHNYCPARLVGTCRGQR